MPTITFSRGSGKYRVRIFLVIVREEVPEKLKSDLKNSFKSAILLRLADSLLDRQTPEIAELPGYLLFTYLVYT